MQIFTSPLLQNKQGLLKHFQNAEYAIGHHLEKILPKGGTVGVLYPKTILKKLLPGAAKNKRCKIVYTGEADIWLTEPDGLAEGGGWFRPEELSAVQNIEAVGIGSIYQWVKIPPETHDRAPLQKVITEIGVYTPENLEQELSVFSWPEPLTPSVTSQDRLPAP